MVRAAAKSSPSARRSATTRILNRSLPDPVHVPANLTTAAGLLAYAKWHGASFDDLGLDPRRVPAGIVTGVAAALPVAAIVAATVRRRGRACRSTIVASPR